MSGIYFTVNQDAPGGLDESARQVRAGLASIQVAVAMTQSEAARFMREYGAAVVAGHGDVGAPGRMGDPDLGGPDASDG
jgi:hypothetical protein